MKEIFQPYLKKNINLNDWVTEMIKWHFSEETGSEFWLDKRKELDFNPIKDIKTYEDIYKFGVFDDSILKNISMEYFIPRGFKGDKNKIRVFETGGTLGTPKRIIDYSYRKEVAGWISYSLDKHGFPKEGNWLHLGPAGPHVVGHTTSELAHIRGNGLCYYVDIDTRWIKVLVKNGDKKGYEEYLNHVLSQAVDILKTQKISCIMTTPKLLPELAERFPLEGIKGIILGGTHVTTSFYKLLKKEIVKDIPLCINYGNTLAGVAPQVKSDDTSLEDNSFKLKYYGMFPYFTLNVVDYNDPFKSVEYNEKGRIAVTVLTKDYFLPNVLERDEAIRIPASGEYAWDGVANIVPYSNLNKEIIEGVY